MAETEAAPAPAPEAPPPEAPAAPPAAPDAAPPRDPNNVYTQAEIDQITAKVRKNVRYRTRKEVEAYYQGRESVAAPAPAPAAAEAPAKEEPPKRDQFGTYEEYLRADAAFTAERKADERFEKREREASEKTAREQAQARAAEFQGKVREKYPDFDERLRDVGDMPMHRGVQDAISESEFGPDILNELVGSRTELERLAKLSEASAVREIGKMEARHEAALKAKPQAPAPENPDPKAVKEPSQAPAPLVPVSAPKASGPVNDIFSAKLQENPEAWARERAKQERKSRAG